MKNFTYAFVFAVLAGCAGTVAVSGNVETPDLVEVSPGVQVVADYDEPTFFAEGYYWRNEGGSWYRSGNYANGFVAWESPPTAVVHVDHPEHYAHYKPSGYVVHHAPTHRPEAVHRAPAAHVEEHHGEEHHGEEKHEEHDHDHH